MIAIFILILLQGEAPIESFTMSVDRGYLGRTPGQERDSQIHRSMDDLTFQKTKGLELVRLLRVSTHLHRMSVYQTIVISLIFKFWKN